MPRACKLLEVVTKGCEDAAEVEVTDASLDQGREAGEHGDGGDPGGDEGAEVERLGDAKSGRVPCQLLFRLRGLGGPHFHLKGCWR